MPNPKKVLITGALGLVGNAVYRRLSADPAAYDVYGLTRRPQASARCSGDTFLPIPGDKLRLADLTDPAAVQQAVQGMEVVVHLAANPSENAPWQSILDNNIAGTYHVFEACRLAGVKRIIYGSSIRVVFGYGDEEPYKSLLEARFEGLAPEDVRPITHLQPVRPIDLYAAGKVCGEALAHVYAQTFGLSCLCLRIGWVAAEDRPSAAWGRSLWSSQRDIAQLVQRCIDAPSSLRFDIFHGLSANRYMLADIEHAREVLGYEPEDGLEY